MTNYLQRWLYQRYMLDIYLQRDHQRTDRNTRTGKLAYVEDDLTIFFQWLSYGQRHGK